MKKLELFSYSRRFPKIFEKEKKRISGAVKNCGICHIGSTAIPGLGGKGIIDIMVALDSWKEAEEAVKKLKGIGFGHVHPKEKGRIFLSNREKTGPGDFHIHIVKKGSRAYKDLLAFRDYLRKNKKEARKLFKLKLKWRKEGGKDRKKYGELKGSYVKGILKKAG